MRIHHILDGISIILTNEENSFVNQHPAQISLSSLHEHELWTAQNLVRKGVYRLNDHSTHLILHKKA
jgi:hypothetical protein